jgi:quercetin dioxygenase-like cupin family protein
MTTKLAALVLLCLTAGTAMAEEPKVVPLMTKDLADDPGKEVLMITVEHVPGGSSAIHRHDAQAFVYVLEGSVVMQLKGGEEVTLTPGQSMKTPTTFISSTGTQAAPSRRNSWCS